MSTDAKRAGNVRHQSKLDRIVIQPYREDGAAIRSAAAQAGQSVQAYILQAIDDRMERDGSRLGKDGPRSAQEAPAPDEAPE